MDDYIELKDLSKKARETKIKQYIADKKEAFEKYKTKVQGKVQHAQALAHKYGVKGKVVYEKVASGFNKVQKAAAKIERRMPKRTTKSNDLFGDMGFGGSTKNNYGIKFGSSGSDDYGMGDIFGHPTKKKHKRR